MMDDIKNIVGCVIGNIAEKNPHPENRVERIWMNLLNEQERAHTKIFGIKENTLFVYVDSPAWLHQMRIKQSKILKQLKEEVSDIKYIRLKIGKI